MYVVGGYLKTELKGGRFEASGSRSRNNNRRSFDRRWCWNSKGQSGVQLGRRMVPHVFNSWNALQFSSRAYCIWPISCPFLWRRWQDPLLWRSVPTQVQHFPRFLHFQVPQFAVFLQGFVIQRCQGLLFFVLVCPILVPRPGSTTGQIGFFFVWINYAFEPSPNSNLQFFSVCLFRFQSGNVMSYHFTVEGFQIGRRNKNACFQQF